MVLLFKDVLSQIEGIDVFGFTEPRLALEHFMGNSLHYSTVLSDYKMPDMNGIELLRNMKKINSSVRTLLMTAFEVDDKLFSECPCIDKMLQKPIHVPALMTEIGENLKNPRMLRMEMNHLG